MAEGLKPLPRCYCLLGLCLGNLPFFDDDNYFKCGKISKWDTDCPWKVWQALAFLVYFYKRILIFVLINIFFLSGKNVVTRTCMGGSTGAQNPREQIASTLKVTDLAMYYGLSFDYKIVQKIRNNRIKNLFALLLAFINRYNINCKKICL